MGTQAAPPPPSLHPNKPWAPLGRGAICSSGPSLAGGGHSCPSGHVGLGSRLRTLPCCPHPATPGCDTHAACPPDTPAARCARPAQQSRWEVSAPPARPRSVTCSLCPVRPVPPPHRHRPGARRTGTCLIASSASRSLSAAAKSQSSVVWRGCVFWMACRGGSRAQCGCPLPPCWRAAVPRTPVSGAPPARRCAPGRSGRPASPRPAPSVQLGAAPRQCQLGWRLGNAKW